jgi:sugar fermentation stimulation protein A
LFAANRSDAKRVVPADDIDPEYGRKLREAKRAGVEVLAYKAALSPREVRLAQALPVEL